MSEQVFFAVLAAIAAGLIFVAIFRHGLGIPGLTRAREKDDPSRPPETRAGREPVIGAVDLVQYDASHMEVIVAGMDSILTFYEKADRSEVRSLLFCLDQYLDPYYGHKLEHADAIFSWLTDRFYAEDDPTIKQEIYELVFQYSDIELKGFEIDSRGNLVEKSGD